MNSEEHKIMKGLRQRVISLEFELSKTNEELERIKTSFGFIKRHLEAKIRKENKK